MYVSNSQGLILVIGTLDLYDFRLKSMVFVGCIIASAAGESLRYIHGQPEIFLVTKIYVNMHPGPHVYRKTSRTKKSRQPISSRFPSSVQSRVCSHDIWLVVYLPL